LPEGPVGAENSNLKKKLNHRGRRARRGKHGQRLEAHGAREKATPFPTLPGRPKPEKRFSGKDLCALGFLFSHLLVFLRRGYRERKVIIPQNEKLGIHRREPGGRRDANMEIFIIFFAMKKVGAIHELPLQARQTHPNSV
jgi:hypothetical protein